MPSLTGPHDNTPGFLNTLPLIITIGFVILGEGKSWCTTQTIVNLIDEHHIPAGDVNVHNTEKNGGKQMRLNTCKYTRAEKTQV